MRAISLLIVLSSTIAIVVAAGQKRPADVKELLGDKAAVLEGPDRVEVFRVGHEVKPADARAQIAGHLIKSVAKEQGKDFAGRLATVLVDPKTYDFEIARACDFTPGVGYRIWKEKESAEVLVCFDCDAIKINNHIIDATPAARAALVKLAKQSLPEDKEIQALTEQRK